ncbi:MAG: tRNA (adenosine(37)-N6)-threonylcarbamoyltransferase complex transferase subunit TsaD [Pseudomonadota bacterium]
MQKSPRVLGIETSCDETAAAIVTRDRDGEPEILSNVVLSQIEKHAEFGGVVPELAARAHVATLDKIVNTALQEAQCSLDEIDCIAATAGPGLVGGLMVGVMTAKAISASRKIPFLGINHLEGHALTARLTDNIPYPYLLLLVSGGHSQILRVDGLGKYTRLATTIDDAVGETFDKTAKLLGLGFPGGPKVEQAAQNGDKHRFKFPKPLQGKDTLNLSLSGLKTAVRNQAEKLEPLSETDISDLCASMQHTIAQLLAERCARAIAQYGASIDTLVVAGGVAANCEIRSALEDVCKSARFTLIAPPLDLCGDNAAMIAWAGLERFERGETSSLDVAPRSRWPLDEDAASMVGSGRKGVKV